MRFSIRFLCENACLFRHIYIFDGRFLLNRIQHETNIVLFLYHMGMLQKGSVLNREYNVIRNTVKTDYTLPLITDTIIFSFTFGPTVYTHWSM